MPSLTLETTGKSPHVDADMRNAASLFGSQREIARAASSAALSPDSIFLVARAGAHGHTRLDQMEVRQVRAGPDVLRGPSVA